MSEGEKKCDVCGEGFDTKKGVSVHETLTHSERKWRDESWLREEYVQKEKSAAQIANEVDCSHNTILKRLREEGFDIREGSIGIKNYWKQQPAGFHTGEDGYEYWTDQTERSFQFVLHHRLLAVVEYGVDEIEGKDIHHKNGIPWDNRPENIEPLGHGEHMELHWEEWRAES